MNRNDNKKKELEIVTLTKKMNGMIGGHIDKHIPVQGRKMMMLSQHYRHAQYDQYDAHIHRCFSECRN